MMTKKSYSELSKLKTFDERFDYLKLNDRQVGEETFASHRYLNQKLYKSPFWKKVRDEVIARDKGRNLGLVGEEFGECEEVIVHHINPITIEDLVEMRPCVFDTDNLISTNLSTHNEIHYGKKENISRLVERKPGDTKLW